MNFLAIGDTVVDEFIKLKEAQVACGDDREHCTLSIPWGDKISFDSSVLVPAVGNAANAAVAAARLGLSAGFISNVGRDRFGEDILATFAKEGVDTIYVAVNDGIPTNHHYVLWYEAERTILIRHEAYPYSLPDGLPPPSWLYLSSLGEQSKQFHHELAAWLAAHTETKLAFQPGTYQIKMGKEELKELYAATEVFACNKEEAEHILNCGETDIKELLEKTRALGPRTVLITDGPQGAYAFDGVQMLKVPMYPDPEPAYDRTGAGDAMTATFVVALALQKSLTEALRWGPVNAMSVVQHLGAQKGLLTREALLQYLADAPPEYRVEAL